MARRKSPGKALTEAIDNKDAKDAIWALLDLARHEYKFKGAFETLSSSDVVKLLLALYTTAQSTNEVRSVISADLIRTLKAKKKAV